MPNDSTLSEMQKKVNLRDGPERFLKSCLKVLKNSRPEVNN